MVDQKWTTRSIETAINGLSRLCYLDANETSPTPLNNKTITVNDFTQFQNVNGVKKVFKTADMPFNDTATFTTSGTVGQPALFTFVYDAGTPADLYATDNNLRITGSSNPAYDGEITITILTPTTFTAVNFTGSPILVLAGGPDTGDLVRILEDKDYKIFTSITIPLGLGYEGVNDYTGTITSESRTKFKFSMTGNGTFLKLRNVRLFSLDDVDVLDISGLPGSSTNTLFDIEGTYNLALSAVIVTRSLLQNFQNLGTLKGLIYTVDFITYNSYTNGFVTEDIQPLQGTAIILSQGNGSTFMKVNNSKELYIPTGAPIPFERLDTPSALNFSNIQPFLFANDILLDVNPSNNIINSNIVTDSSATFGGKIFKDSTFADSGTITAFAAAPAPRDATHTLLTVGATNLDNGQLIKIQNTTNFQDDFIVSALTATTIEIEIPFEGTDTTGTWQAYRFVQAFTDGGTSTATGPLTYSSNGQNGTTVTASANLPADFIKDRSVLHAGTTNYLGSFHIFNLTANSYDIQDQFVATETSGGTATMFLTNLAAVNHNLTTGIPVLVSEAIDFNEGGIVRVIGAFNDSLTIDITFPSPAPIAQTGKLLDGSLTGETAKNVTVANVAGELNSASKMSFHMNGNLEPTPLTLDEWSDIVLSGGATPVPVKITFDKDWEIIDKVKGKWKYVGIKDFKGHLTLPLIFTSANNKDISLRILKNNGRMPNQNEKSFTTQNAQTAMTIGDSIFAQTNDEFNVQVINRTDSVDVTFTNFEPILQ